MRRGGGGVEAGVPANGGPTTTEGLMRHMRRPFALLHPRVALSAVLGIITLLGAPASALAVTTGATAPELGMAIAAQPGTVTAASYLDLASPAAASVVSKPIGGLPTSGGAFALLSTGDASIIDQPNDSGSSGADLGGASVRGDTDFDVTVLKLDVNVPSGANCMVGLDFRYYSDEYPEYVGSAYNDAFIAELDETSWTTSGSAITAPANFAFDPSGNPITINAAGVTSMTMEEAAGTTFDGATPLLRAATPITPGPHSIYLSIFDQGDHVLDSAVIVDNLRFGYVGDVAADCKPGAVPVDTQLDYVALGDSYSSGEGAGAGNYFQDDKGRDIKCHRAPTAWSFVLAKASARIDDNVENAACSGAKTQAVTSEWYKGEQPQVNRLRELANAQDVDLVTITIGGNDIGFGRIARNCFLVDCQNELKDNKKQPKLDKLKARLATSVYPALKQAAPGARIVAVGYPRLLPAAQSNTTGCGWLEPNERVLLNKLVDDLNWTIRQAAFIADVDYVDVTNALSGHELCSADSHVVKIYGNAANSEQAHPDANGQRDYAAAVRSGLKVLGIG